MLLTLPSQLSPKESRKPFFRYLTWNLPTENPICPGNCGAPDCGNSRCFVCVVFLLFPTNSLFCLSTRQKCPLFVLGTMYLSVTYFLSVNKNTEKKKTPSRQACSYTLHVNVGSTCTPCLRCFRSPSTNQLTQFATVAQLFSGSHERRSISLLPPYQRWRITDLRRSGYVGIGLFKFRSPI